MPSQPIATWTTPWSSRRVVAAGTSRRRQTIGLTCSSRTFSWRAGPMLGRSGSAGSSGRDGLAVFSRRDATGRQRRLPASAPQFLMLSYLEDLVASGRLGRLTSLRAAFNHTIPHVEGEFRRLAGMGGGVLREFGCYPVHWCRSLVREEPEVVSAEAKLTEGGVDADATALLRFPSGVLAGIEARMSAGWDMRARLLIEGTRGRIRATNALLS